MTHIIVDAAMRTKLLALRQPVQLCDESGHILAHLTPVLNPADCRLYEPPPLSADEWKRREEETEDFSTAEVLAILEKL
jgi:hypothetical protein